LQVTSAAAAAGAAAALDDASELASVESFDLEAFFGLDVAAGAASAAVLDALDALDALEALLSTPPWPLQAPFPA
jgi:hypothetical protein